MSRIIIVFDPSEKLQRGELPPEIRWAQMDVGNLTYEDISAVSQSLAELLLNQLNETNQP